MRKSIVLLTVAIMLTFVSFSFAQTTVTLISDPVLDGFVASSGSVLNNIQDIQVGDNQVNNVARGFVSFDITGIPPGSNILSATLRVYQNGVNGTPYTDLGNVIVDHLDYGPTLDSSDFSLAPLLGNIGTLSNNTTIEYKTLVVTARVQNDINNSRTRSQYRMLFTTQTDNDNVEDSSFFIAGGYANPPQLVVTYALLPTPTAVPTITEWGIIILIALLAGAGTLMLRKRQESS